MPAYIYIVALAALSAAVLWLMAAKTPIRADIPEGIRFSVEPEEPTASGEEFVTIYMFIDDEYHSLDLIVGTETNGYRYGAGTEWRGTAATLMDALECAKMYMIHEAKKGGVV